MNDFAVGLLLTVGGAIWTAHCARMTWRGLRRGAASRKFADYPQAAHFGAFGAIILVNSLAALLGIFFLTIGLIVLMGIAR